MTLLILDQKLDHPAAARGSLTLPFALRQKSRLRARLDDGSEAGLFLPRGTFLRGGDLLTGPAGVVIEVRAAPEEISTASADDPLALARACYHLGNRHMPVQIGAGWVRYRHDHVLDAMVAALGLQVSCEQLPFEPEPGAYGDHAMLGGHGHHHAHG